MVTKWRARPSLQVDRGLERCERDRSGIFGVRLVWGFVGAGGAARTHHSRLRSLFAAAAAATMPRRRPLKNDLPQHPTRASKAQCLATQQRSDDMRACW